MTHQLYPCLWFDGKAKEAADFYCAVFKDSKLVSTNPLVTIFEINGSKFMGLNGGPQFKFNESVSLVITCDTQEEIDYYWNTLTQDGEESQCGWLKDKYGLSWQVVPSILPQLMSNPEKSEKVIQAFLKMKKFDIQTLLAV